MSHPWWSDTWIFLSNFSALIPWGHVHTHVVPHVPLTCSGFKFISYVFFIAFYKFQMLFGRQPTCNKPLEVFVLLLPCMIHGLGDREPASCTVSIGYMCVRACSVVSDPTDCNLPGSSVHGISQARILQWVAISSSWESSQPRDRTHVSCVSCVGRWVLYHWCHLWSPK